MVVYNLSVEVGESDEAMSGGEEDTARLRRTCTRRCESVRLKRKSMGTFSL
jgi:hypothetical protein